MVLAPTLVRVRLSQCKPFAVTSQLTDYKKRRKRKELPEVL